MRATHHVTASVIAALLVAACNPAQDEAGQHESANTIMEVCSETDIGFHPGSSDLSGTAQSILLDTLDKLGTDCDTARIRITAWRSDEGDELATGRIETIESEIRASYGLPNHFITSEIADAPSDHEAGRVKVELILEIPAAG